MSRDRYVRLFEGHLEHEFVFSRHEARFLASAFEAAYPSVRYRFKPLADVPPKMATKPSRFGPRSQAQGA